MKKQWLFLGLVLLLICYVVYPSDLRKNVAVSAALASDLTCSGCVASTDIDLTGTYAWTGLHTYAGGRTTTIRAITGADALTSADCSRPITVTVGIDGSTITLPEASTVIGCVYKIIYIGADAGALVDLSPLDSDADGIEGNCTLAGSIVELSGTADADIGLTKATINTGDYLEVTAVGAAMWALTDSQGICANN